MNPVRSSHLKAVGYDEESRTMRVEFHNGTYLYFDVPRTVYEGLLRAPSKGRFHAARIKYKYRYQKDTEVYSLIS